MVFTPECAQEGDAFRVFSPKANVLAACTEVRRSHLAAFVVRPAQPIYSLTQPTTIANALPDGDIQEEQRAQQAKAQEHQPILVNRGRAADEPGQDAFQWRLPFG